MITAIESMVEGLPVVVVGTGASLLAGLMSGVGALPVAVGGAVSQRRQNTLLGFAAGVMLAASAFSLILPGIESGTEIYGDSMVAAALVSLGVLGGAAGIGLLHHHTPHEHFIKGREGADSGQLRRLWLFVIAITLHNFPEGLAVGVGFGGGDIRNGAALAAGIGLQNLPEGLAVAVALLTVGYSRHEAVFVALLTGLVEPLGGFVGSGAVSLAEPLLPLGLAFAGGAMLFVISNEIIPETHRRGTALNATAGLLVGFVCMTMLDVLLG